MAHSHDTYPHVAARRILFHQGFTLIELLVVISIIGVIASLLLPSLQMVRNSANKLKCSSNMRQLGIATLAYAGDFDDQLPNIRVNYPGYSVNWASLIAPYIDGGKDKNSDGIISTAEMRDTSVIKGCPVYIPPKNSPHLSYAMSTFLLKPESGACNGLESDGSPLFGSTFKTFTYARLTYPSSRILYAERDREDNIWNWTLITYRHKGRSTALFCDGHVGTVTPAEAFMAMESPR